MCGISPALANVSPLCLLRAMPRCALQGGWLTVGVERFTTATGIARVRLCRCEPRSHQIGSRVSSLCVHAFDYGVAAPQVVRAAAGLL